VTAETGVAFTAAVLVFAAIPGPAILACIAQALGSGFRSALALAAGIVLGDILFFLVAIYGLAVFAALLQGLFVVVRIAGGGYLLWMGWRLWTGTSTPPRGESTAPASRHAFRAGLLLTLGNPKVILFYLGFLPAFMDLSEVKGVDVAAAVVLLAGVLMAVNASYVWMAAKARNWVESPAATRRLRRGAGAILAVAGLFAMFEG